MGKLREELSSAELALYMAYDRIDPFGEVRGDIRNAMQLRQQAEMHRNKQEHPEPFQLKDFMPQWIQSRKDSDVDTTSMRSKFRNLIGRKR